MARSDHPLGAIAAAAALAFSLSACSLLGGSTTPTPAPVGVAPLPQQYTCAESRQAAAEYRALPADSMLRRYIDDYGTERRRLRAVHKLPESAPCDPAR